MIDITVDTPTDLWVELGKVFFCFNEPGCSVEMKGQGGKREKDIFEKAIDLKLGDRRLISIENTFRVKRWPKQWRGEGIFQIVGYSTERGTKMATLRKTYVDESKLQGLKKIILANSKKRFFAVGMNFNMSAQRKGGCLSSFHVLKNKWDYHVYIHGKIAEIPRKFVGDLVMISDLIRSLKLEREPAVTFQFSSVYYSIIGLRAYLPVLGTLSTNDHGLPIDDPRNYQVGVWQAIVKHRKELIKKYGKEIMTVGMYDKICKETGGLL